MSDKIEMQETPLDHYASTESGQEKLEIEIEYDQCINYAIQQNAVPVVKRIKLLNATPLPLLNVLVKITGDPAFCDPWELRIAVLEPERESLLKDVDINLSATFLAGLREKSTGQIKINVSSDDLPLRTANYPIDLLAYDEWPGIRTIPEILAAFVMPNHPSIEPILKDAASLLKTWTEDSSLSGYQTGNPKRAWLSVAAIYTALSKLGISYINPPASFERSGQKVRTPDRILETRLGTCFDLSLLCVSCIEAAGLNPIVVLHNGHAYPGAWLKNETFSPAAIDDIQTLRKRSELGEIVFFESTSLTSDIPREFNQAVLDAAPRLEMDDEFILGIDIKSARRERIRPIPLRAHGVEAFTHQEEKQDNGGIDSVPQVPLSIVQEETAKDKTAISPQSRVDQWKRRLLDLSLRNRLLNFRDTQKTVPILCPDLPALEDALAAGEEFKFAPGIKVMSESDPRSAAVHHTRTGEDAQEEFLKEEMASRRLHTTLSEAEQNKRLLETYRSARTAEEEGGANICYLALGFLEWTQRDAGDQVYSAPILLLPVELTRKSIQQGFHLQEHDDEPRINITLLQMLEKDFNLQVTGLDPLPRDQSGIDVQSVLQTFRTAVRDIKGWEVKNVVRLGLFSFTKYLMWKDLEDRTEDLMRNSVVEHLIKNPETPYPFQGEKPDADRIDDELRPANTFCPRDADSSQLASVLAASRGISFVMEGPPGTGKSQTITNIIAQSLAEGKTVLFVAEKMAALNVVYDRLRGVGLAPYCLELHSSKAKKTDVLQQLAARASAVSNTDVDEWEQLGRSLGSLRTELNQYAALLHRVYPNGLTAFSVTSSLVGMRDEPVVPISWQSVDIHTRADLQNLKGAVDELATTARPCGSIADNRWFGFEHTEWSPGWAQELESQVDTLGKCIIKLEESIRELAPRFGIEGRGFTFRSLKRIEALGAVMLRSPGVSKPMLDIGDWEDFRHRVAEVGVVGRKRDSLRTKLFSEYSTEIANADVSNLRDTWMSASESWWALRWIRRHKVKTALKALHKVRKVPADETIAGILSDVETLQELHSHVASVSGSVGGPLGRFWRGGDPDWEEVDKMCEWVNSFREGVYSVADGDAQKSSIMCHQLSETVTTLNDQLKLDGQIGNSIISFTQSLAEFESAREALSRTGGVNDAKVWGDGAAVDLISVSKKLVDQWKPAVGSLRYWCAWQSARSNAKKLGLAAIVDAIESGSIRTEGLERVFTKSYYLWWLNSLTDQEPLLRQFLREVHEKKIERFRNTDAAFVTKTKGAVTAKLSEERPDPSSTRASSTSEMGVLTRELRRVRRLMPVRTLLSKIPNLLPRLKPCLLMSPLSVSQYLQAGRQPFDVVIFDEASQIPVWDAVGAIARGKQVIIAGDPKQLPPTNFFVKAEEDDEIIEEDLKVEDLESVLDECMGAGLPPMRLNWHYRSRHESLIAFSNSQYYQNSLQTFPSAVTNDSAVSFRHVPSGVYDKGKTRTNREEARAIVSEVIERLTDPTTCNETMGIVTFNLAQQRLIEDMLESERSLHPEIEKYFSPEVEEPVFVKNLENVQGDERDVIFFSVCYGRDLSGKVSLNFGPMNKDGGQRRLNVAITRARNAVRVFSSITGDEIDLRRTQARGVGDLKLFLEYAQRGPSILAPSVSSEAGAEFGSVFEQQVHDALAERGWQSNLQVGCSGFRVDLGIIDKQNPDRYLAGIQCDGGNYHSAKSARDRDRLRQSVLQGLGWKLIRIWSTDWWLEPQRELDRVDGLLHAIEAGPSQCVENGNQNRKDPDPDSTKIMAAPAVGKPETAMSPHGRQNSEPTYTHYIAFSKTPKDGSQLNFYDSYQNSAIRETIVKTIALEGPISLDLLVHRVGMLWGFSRAGNGVRGRVVSLILEGTVNLTRHNGMIWYWPLNLGPERYTDFRVSVPGESDAREIADIAPEEIGNAALSILKQHISIERDELAREVYQLFGYSRLSVAGKAHADYGIHFLILRGFARMDGNMVVLEQ